MVVSSVRQFTAEPLVTSSSGLLADDNSGSVIELERLHAVILLSRSTCARGRTAYSRIATLCDRCEETSSSSNERAEFADSLGSRCSVEVRPTCKLERRRPMLYSKGGGVAVISD
jgi:hypothetical protein